MTSALQVQERSTVASTAAARTPVPVGTLEAAILGAGAALAIGALIADVAYAVTYEIQWQNFASWLIVGALVPYAVALVLALIGLVRRHRRPRAGAHALVLAVTWLALLMNALMHARDAWASMPGGLVLAFVGAVLACVVVWLGGGAPPRNRP